MSEIVHPPRPLQMIWEDVLDSESETIISKLSWRPVWAVDSMISIQESIQIPLILSNSQRSSIGRLDALPIEILHTVLNLLDFQSLSRLTLTSHLAKATVESLPAYRDMMKHAPKALLGLSKLQVIKLHSAATLHTALRSENCIVCRSFAPFLYLLTCERCCFSCIRNGKSFRLIPHRLARIGFGLTPKEIRQLPSLLNIPGTYFKDSISKHRERINLVSSRQAREAGLALHGSAENLMEYMMTHNGLGITNQERFEVDLLYRSFFVSDDKYPLELYDPYRGMGSVFFPILRRDQTLDDGLWCLGCNFLRENEDFLQVPQVSSSFPEDCNLYVAIWTRALRAWSRAEFIDHVKQCECAKYVLYDL